MNEIFFVLLQCSHALIIKAMLCLNNYFHGIGHPNQYTHYLFKECN